MTTKEYLTVAEALELVLGSVSALPPETVPILEALNRILAEAVVASDSLPPFANSAMDGYALRSEDVAMASKQTPVTLDVVGDVAAGGIPRVDVRAGQAVRIMTGAPVPPGADAVVPVEDTNEPWRDSERPLPASVVVSRSVQGGAYVRLPGEDIEAGAEVLSHGHLLRAQEIGVLASLGVSRVKVVRRPRVGVLATGDELITVEAPLTPGKIRNSNGYAQRAQVASLGALPVDLGIARDTAEDVRARLDGALALGVDLIVSSAGVSVGAYDVVKAVLEAEGNVGFWRVRMRPGKPLAQGTYRGIPFLGLPGNPVSAMVSFERFARPAILKMSGHARLDRPEVTVTMRDEIHSDGRETYARAIIDKDERGRYVATTTGTQGSHIMTSLVKANALVIVPEGVTYVPSGGTLMAMMIDWPPEVF